MPSEDELKKWMKDEDIEVVIGFMIGAILFLPILQMLQLGIISLNALIFGTLYIFWSYWETFENKTE